MANESEISFYGQVYSTGCPGCTRIEPQPLGLDNVLESKYFRVHQDYELPIPGMMVIESKKHVPSLVDFSSPELSDFVIVLNKVRVAMLMIGLDEATLVQEERSPHFHAWWLPIHPWMKELARGKVRNIQQIFDHAKSNVSAQAIKDVENATLDLKKILSN